MSEPDTGEAGGVYREWDDAWGPHREVIEAHVNESISHLAELLQALESKTPASREDVRNHSRGLHTAARDLMRRTQDIERWLNECGAEIEHPGGEIGTCALPTRHRDPHDDTPPLSPVAVASSHSRRLADQMDNISHQLGGFAMRYDSTQRPPAELRSKQKQLLQDVGQSLDEVVSDATRLRRLVHSTEQVFGRGYPHPEPNRHLGRPGLSR